MPDSHGARRAAWAIGACSMLLVGATAFAGITSLTEVSEHQQDAVLIGLVSQAPAASLACSTRRDGRGAGARAPAHDDRLPHERKHQSDLHAHRGRHGRTASAAPGDSQAQLEAQLANREWRGSPCCVVMVGRAAWFPFSRPFPSATSSRTWPQTPRTRCSLSAGDAQAGSWLSYWVRAWPRECSS